MTGPHAPDRPPHGLREYRCRRRVLPILSASVLLFGLILSLAQVLTFIHYS